MDLRAPPTGERRSTTVVINGMVVLRTTVAGTRWVKQRPYPGDGGAPSRPLTPH